MRLVSHPLTNQALAKAIEVEAHASLGQSDLNLSYEIIFKDEAQASAIHFAETQKNPLRKNELWKDTCFECFIPNSKSKFYYELNLSPSGNWNLYSFQDYREVQIELPVLPGDEPKIVKFEKTSRGVKLEAKVALRNFNSVSTTEIARLGLTTVIRFGAATTYWALAHMSEKPDFHLESSFIFKI